MMVRQGFYLQAFYLRTFYLLGFCLSNLKLEFQTRRPAQRIAITKA